MAKNKKPYRVDRRDVERGRLSILRDLLYTTLRFIARHIKGFWGAIVAFLTIGTIVGLIAAGAFALIALAVTGGLTQTFDEAVLEWLATHRSPRLDEFMADVTSLGDGIVLIVLIAVASVFLWQTRHHWSVYLLLVSVIGGNVLNELLKRIFERPRPSIVEAIDIVHSASFPSGHAMTSFVAYGSVAYLVARLEPTPRLRRTTWALAALIILAIGVSRMYLGVHYPSDVIAGFVGGLAWLTFVAAAMTALRFFSYRRPETRAEEAGLDQPQASTPIPAASIEER